MKNPSILALLFSLAASTWAGQDGEPDLRKFDQTNLVSTVAALPGEEKVRAIDLLRSEMHAKDTSATRRRVVRLALIDLADQDAMHDTMRQFRDGFIRARQDMGSILKESSQPDVILELAAEVSRDEEAKPRLYNAEFFDYPSSVRASEIICRIIQNSPEFGQPVKAWAETLSVTDPQKLRDEVRRWLADNHEHLASGNYGSTVPPAGQ